MSARLTSKEIGVDVPDSWEEAMEMAARAAISCALESDWPQADIMIRALVEGLSDRKRKAPVVPIAPYQRRRDALRLFEAERE